MALRPPRDFRPPQAPPRPPSQRELLALWNRYEAARRERERADEWRHALEECRRDEEGVLHPPAADVSPSPYLADDRSLGPQSRAALRPLAKQGRVSGAGIDTWSPCWYAEPGSPLVAAMQGLATRRSGLAAMLPEPLAGHRVGWFADHGLVFAEGRPGGEFLCSADQTSVALELVEASMEDVGIPVSGVASAGLRRLDVAADLLTDSAADGLALLECVGAASLGSGKLAVYRSDRRVETVLAKTKAGRTYARVYDKGSQTASAPRGSWIRFEAQWRFPRAKRPAITELSGALLRERFVRRFAALWAAAGGFRLGGLAAIGDRLASAVRSGQLLPSRARSIAGYLILAANGIPQGSERTAYELERECRELGLSVSLLESIDREVDVATVLDECLAPEVWH
jgi:hypothetical protein